MYKYKKYYIEKVAFLLLDFRPLNHAKHIGEKWFM